MTINDIDGGYVVSFGCYGLVAVIIVAVVTLMLVAVIFMVSRIFLVDMHTGDVGKVDCSVGSSRGGYCSGGGGDIFCGVGGGGDWWPCPLCGFCCQWFLWCRSC